MQDLVSMIITQEQEDEINSLFDRLEAILPGLITLDPDDRGGMTMAGAKSERYLRGNITLGQQNAGLIPADVDLAGAVRDLAARDRMFRITARAKKFAGKCEDTTDALGSDLMVAANMIYAILKVVGKAVGLDEAVKELGYRWARGKKKPKQEKELSSE